MNLHYNVPNDWENGIIPVINEEEKYSAMYLHGITEESAGRRQQFWNLLENMHTQSWSGGSRTRIGFDGRISAHTSQLSLAIRRGFPASNFSSGRKSAASKLLRTFCRAFFQFEISLGILKGICSEVFVIRKEIKRKRNLTKASISRLQTMAKVYPNLVISGVVRRKHSVRRLIGASGILYEWDGGKAPPHSYKENDQWLQFILN